MTGAFFLVPPSGEQERVVIRSFTRTHSSAHVCWLVQPITCSFALPSPIRDHPGLGWSLFLRTNPMENQIHLHIEGDVDLRDAETGAFVCSTQDPSMTGTTPTARNMAKAIKMRIEQHQLLVSSLERLLNALQGRAIDAATHQAMSMASQALTAVRQHSTGMPKASRVTSVDYPTIDLATHEIQSFLIDVDDRRSIAGELTVNIANAKGATSDALQAEFGIQRLPGTTEQLPYVELQFNPLLNAGLFFRTKDCYVFKPGSGVSIHPLGSHAEPAGYVIRQQPIHPT